MKDKEIIVSTIKENLSKFDDKGKVIFLSGPWGCGKTYLWKKEISKLLDKDKDKIVNISLFGVESISALKIKIMTACSIRKAKSIKEAPLDVSKDKLLVFMKGLGGLTSKALDSHIRRNYLKIDIDYTLFFDEKLIYCFDDLERKGKNLEIEEVLGLADYLALEKKSNIFLILNDEKIAGGQKESQATEEQHTFSEYLEKVGSINLKADADIDSIYDLFIQKYHENKVIFNFFIAHKSLLVNTFERAQHNNLRSLERVMSAIVLMINHKITINEKHIVSLAAFIMEWAEGKLNDDRAFYDFDGMKMHILKDIDNDEYKARKRFHKKYFDYSNKYLFVDNFYNYVQKGYFDFVKLKNEINPDPQKLTKGQKLLHKAMDANWYFMTDIERHAWLEETSLFLKSVKELKMNVLIPIIGCLRSSLKELGEKIPSDIENEIKRLMERNVNALDDSFNHFLKMQYASFSEYWKTIVDDYELKRENKLEQKRIKEIKIIIRKGSDDEILSFFYEIGEEVDVFKLFLEDDILKELNKIRKKSTKFFHQVIQVLLEKLQEYAGSTIFENLEDYQAKIVVYLKTILDDKKTDKLEKMRIKNLLNEFGA